MKIKLFVTFCLLFYCFTSALSSNDDSFKKIQSKGTLIIGLDATFAPMGFKDKKGEIVGFDIDLAKEVGKRLNLKIILQPCVWDSIFFELKNGNIDAIWNGLTINEERKTNALFSRPYMTNKVVILVNENSNIKRLADLKNKKIAAQAGAPAVDYIKKYKSADFNPRILKELAQYPDNAMAFYDLVQGGVDAVAVDEIFADYYITTQKLKLRKLPDFIAEEQIGIAFRKNDIALRNQIQAAIDAIVRDGSGSKISKKWFGRDIFSKNNYEL